MPQRSVRAQRAMAHLPEADPALAALSIWCKVTDGDGRTKTAGDMIHIGEDFTTRPLRDQVGLLGHHILHVALRHESRMAAMAQRLGRGFDPQTYNLAADAIVNECLVDAGHAIPRPAVMLADLLMRVAGPDLPRSLADWDVDRLYMMLSAMDGEGKTQQETYAEEAAFESDLEPGLSGDDAQDTAEWQGHLTSALELSDAAGRGIGRVLVGLADLPRTSTPWEVILRRCLSNAVQEHPRLSYARPRRNWIAADAEARWRGGPKPVFEPGQSRDARRPRIVVGLDTSGSVSAQSLALLSAEVSGVARRTGAETHVLSFDETVHHRAMLAPGMEAAALLSQPMRRDGGTAFVEVMEEAQSLDPSIILILTDLDGAFGPAPTVDVVWATPHATWAEPPFGKVISLAR